MIDKLLAYIAPHHCYGCNNLDGPLCDNCKYNIVIEPYSRCLGCARPVGPNGVCRTCKLPYSRAWCVGERAGVLRKLIDAYKFERSWACHKPLSDLLLSIMPELPADTVIVPVPTIPTHRRQRGYDHTLLVARRIARSRKLQLSPRILKRKNYSVQRDATSRRQRHNQAKQAFTVTASLNSSAHYLLIDDVMTSGATLYWAAKTLRVAGARTIWVAVVARQVSTRDD